MKTSKYKIIVAIEDNARFKFKISHTLKPQSNKEH